MAAEMKVKISGDLAEIRAALVGLQQQLKGVGASGRAAGQEASNGLGGIGSSLAKLAGAYLSFRSVVSIFSAVVRNTVEAERAQAQLRAALAASGGAAGLSADQLNAMAAGLQAVSRFDDDAITGAQTLLLQFDRIGGETFPRATKAVLDFAERMGVDLNAAAKAVGKALQDPEKGLRGLKDAGVDLEEGQQDLIAHLVETGEVAQAQALVLEELERRMGGAAEASRDTLGGALEGLKNDFNNLLEGDAGGEGVRGTTQAINDLGEMMRSPGVQAGFQAIITWAAEAITAVAGLGQAVRDAFASTAQKSKAGLEARRWELQDRRSLLMEGREQMGLGRMLDSLSGIGVGPTLEEVNRELAEVEARLRSLQQVAPTLATPSQPTFGLDGQMTIHGGESLADGQARSADKAAAEAKRKVEALRREMEKLREESERADKARREEMIKVEARAREGLHAVEIALQRAAGDEAGAAFQEIDDKYRQLIADLKASGMTAGVELVDRLVNQEKFAAELDAMAAKADAAMRAFGTTVATSEGAVNAGELAPDDADAAIEQSRQSQLATLRQLRQEALAYYRSHSGPEAQAALEAVGQLDGQIRQLEEANDSFKEFAKGEAANALTGFFMDLATGAKSFKDAFLDMLRSFLAGIAQMIAQKLALKAVDAIFSMFHAGGVVGAGGTPRTGVNPMVFGFAPRYHRGGIAGLGPNEVPAILERGEEVLTKRDARHRANGGSQGGGRWKTPVVAFGDRAVADALAGAAGEDVVVTHVMNNWAKISGGQPA